MLLSKQNLLKSVTKNSVNDLCLADVAVASICKHGVFIFLDKIREYTNGRGLLTNETQRSIKYLIFIFTCIILTNIHT